MHYIRFLRTPKVEVDRADISITATICITTDLGETFYPTPIDLITTIRSPAPDGEIYLRRKSTYPASARALKISLDLSRQDIEYPACMHIAARTTNDVGKVGFLPSIVDIWSGSVNPTKGMFESGQRVERRFFSLAERMVSLLEDAGDSVARHLWDGSQALAQHIDMLINMQAAVTVPLLEYVLVSATYRRMNVLELGCGVGSVGIALAQSIPDCSVILTDLEEVRELVDANVSRMRPAISSRVRFEALDWEASALPESLQNRTNDLIIVSECTYNSDTLEALVQMLAKLLVRSPKAIIAVATKTRHESEAVFFNIMRDAGIIEEGSMRLPLPGIPGDGYADWAEDVGLHLFHGRDHRLSLTPRTASDESVPKAESIAGANSR